MKRLALAYQSALGQSMICISLVMHFITNPPQARHQRAVSPQHDISPKVDIASSLIEMRGHAAVRCRTRHTPDRTAISIASEGIHLNSLRALPHAIVLHQRALYRCVSAESIQSGRSPILQSRHSTISRRQESHERAVWRTLQRISSCMGQDHAG